MNHDMVTGLVRQMMHLSGGYQEEKRHSENGTWIRWIRRAIVCVLLLFFCILGIRRGINAYLAKQAEGKLQTASSYQNIYQSFERVEMNQMHLRKKWENHRGINLSIDMGGKNLSYMMSGSSSALSSVMGAVREVTGVGGSGIGQYHQYMKAASGDSDESISYPDNYSADQRADSGQSAIDGGNLSSEDGTSLTDNSQLPVAEPDQFVVQGEYIYMLWLRDESGEGMWGKPHLVIYHAADGQMEQVYESTWKMSGGYETEMMISGNYLYLAMNDASYYEESYNAYYDEMDTCGRPENCLLYVYDISNPAKPQKKDILAQFGSYVSMKIAGEYLYFFSIFQNFAAYHSKNVDAYIPKVGQEKIPPENIYMQRDLYGTGYVVMSAYRLSDSGKPELTDAKAVAGTGECIQMNSDTIYICSQVVPKPSDHTDRTGVTVLSYQEGEITGKEHLIVNGSIDMTREIDVDETRLYLPMQVNTYRAGFVDIEDWILPGWESVPLKIQMQEDAVSTEKQNVCINGIGEKVHKADRMLPKEKIRNTGFEGQLSAVDEENYIGIGHTEGDKHLKLLWYRFSVDDEPKLQAAVSLREHYSPVTLDSRMIYFDQGRSLIGFCTRGSKGTFYYLYHYQKNTDTDEVELQELCQENFGIQGRAYWIRGAVPHPEEHILYMIRSSSMRINELAKPIPFVQ